MSQQQQKQLCIIIIHRSLPCQLNMDVHIFETLNLFRPVSKAFTAVYARSKYPSGDLL